MKKLLTLLLLGGLGVFEGVLGADTQVNFLSFGADPTGARDSAVAVTTLTNLLNRSVSERKASAVYFPSAVYRSSKAPLLTSHGVTLFGDGPTTRFVYTGPGAYVWQHAPATNFHDGRYDIQNILIRDMQLEGTNTTESCLVLERVMRSQFSRITLRNCTGYALKILGGCINEYEHISVSTDDSGVFDTEPLGGIYVDVAPSNGQQAFNSVLINPKISHVRGRGIQFNSTQLWTVIGGGVEWSGDGIEVPNTCQNLTFMGMDLEFNTTNDFTITGHNNRLIGNGCYGTNWIAGRDNQLLGGNFQKLVNLGTRTKIENVSYGYTADGAFEDSGEDTQVWDVWNGYRDQFNIPGQTINDLIRPRWQFFGGQGNYLTNMFDGSGVALNTNFMLWFTKQQGYSMGLWNRSTTDNANGLILRSEGNPLNSSVLTVVGKDGLDKFKLYADGRTFVLTNFTAYGPSTFLNGIFAPSSTTLKLGVNGSTKAQVFETGELTPPFPNSGSVGASWAPWNAGYFTGLFADTLTVTNLNTTYLETTNGVKFLAAATGPSAAAIGAGNGTFWASNSTPATIYWRTSDGATTTDTKVAP